MRPLPPELVARINKALESRKQVQSQSTGASVSFHEKLAVLTAGSLALAVSGAGALYQKPVADPNETHILLWSLVVSACCLWVSLVASVAHNFLESYCLHLDSRVGFLESSLQCFEVLLVP
jgi:hypothetical protein